MSQSDQILTALKRGVRLTPLDALTEFNCMRLASRISALKHEGHTIYTRTVKTPSGKSVSEYWMETTNTPSLFGIDRVAIHGGL